jgi:uncharacterized protein YbjT (DUF2867 family)
MPRVLVAGAGSGVGWETVAAAIKDGFDVVAMIRNEDQRSDLEGMGAKVVIADAFDAASTASAIAETSPDSIVCAIGSKPGDERRVDYEGTKTLVEGAKASGTKRFLLVTSFGCRETRGTIPPGLLEKIGAALAEKDKAEDYIEASGLDWTIMRPGGLGTDPASGTAILTESGDVMGGINRADVAALIISCLKSDKTIGRTLGAIDTQKVRAGEPVPFAI